MRRGAGVNAPFKSPLRTQNTKRADELEISSPVSKAELSRSKRTRTEQESATTDETEIHEEIDRLMKKLMEGRTEPLDVQKELALWRNRMHAYNEAKDACLIIFGRLAHAKGCLVRDLYEEYGLDPSD